MKSATLAVLFTSALLVWGKSKTHTGLRQTADSTINIDEHSAGKTTSTANVLFPRLSGPGPDLTTWSGIISQIYKLKHDIKDVTPGEVLSKPDRELILTDLDMFHYTVFHKIRLRQGKEYPPVPPVEAPTSAQVRAVKGSWKKFHNMLVELRERAQNMPARSLPLAQFLDFEKDCNDIVDLLDDKYESDRRHHLRPQPRAVGAGIDTRMTTGSTAPTWDQVAKRITSTEETLQAVSTRETLSDNDYDILSKELKSIELTLFLKQKLRPLEESWERFGDSLKDLKSMVEALKPGSVYDEDVRSFNNGEYRKISIRLQDARSSKSHRRRDPRGRSVEPGIDTRTTGTDVATWNDVLEGLTKFQA